MFSGIGELLAGALNPLWSLLAGIIEILVNLYNLVVQYFDIGYLVRSIMGELIAFLPDPLLESFWLSLDAKLTTQFDAIHAYVTVANLFVDMPWFFIMFSFFVFGEGVSLPFRVIRFFRSLIIK